MLRENQRDVQRVRKITLVWSALDCFLEWMLRLWSSSILVPRYERLGKSQSWWHNISMLSLELVELQQEQKSNKKRGVLWKKRDNTTWCSDVRWDWAAFGNKKCTKMTHSTPHIMSGWEKSGEKCAHSARHLPSHRVHSAASASSAATNHSFPNCIKIWADC